MMEMKKRCTSYMNIYSNRIDEDIMLELMALDPTGNDCTYSDWIFKQYLLGLKKEDYYKVEESLKEFNREKNRLSKELRDINKYRTYGDLMDMLDGQLHNVVLDEDIGIDPNIKILYDGPLGTLSIPLTREASCKLGKGTRWCTSAEESNNMFDRYNESGKLFVWYDRDWNKGVMKMLGNKSKKFQFHFQEIQFMDEKDEPISKDILQYFRNEHPVLTKLFIDEEANMDDDDVLDYVSSLEIPNGNIFMRAYELDSLELLNKLDKISYQQYNGRKDLDELMDENDEKYLIRCINYSTYENTNKTWNDKNLELYYRLIILKDSYIPETFLQSNPLHLLYYTTYISKKRDINAENRITKDTNVEYINIKDLIRTYLLLYSDEEFSIKMLGNSYVFNIEYINRQLNHAELDFYITNLTDEQIYNIIPKNKGLDNIYRICIARHVHNKYLDTHKSNRLYNRDILGMTYSDNTYYTGNSDSIIQVSQFRPLLEEEFNTLLIIPPYYTLYPLFKTKNFITIDQLKQLYLSDFNSKYYKSILLATIARRGETGFILDHMDFVQEIFNKYVGDRSDAVDIWRLLYKTEATDIIENLYARNNNTYIYSDNNYFKYVMNSKYITRYSCIPIVYLKRENI